MQWGKKWPVQMNLPFFAVEAYVPGGVQNQAEKNSKKCLLAGTGTKIYPGFTFAFAFVVIMLGTRKPQQQATLTK